MHAVIVCGKFALCTVLIYVSFGVNALALRWSGIRNIRTIRMLTGSDVRMAKLAFVPGLILRTDSRDLEDLHEKDPKGLTLKEYYFTCIFG